MSNHTFNTSTNGAQEALSSSDPRAESQSTLFSSSTFAAAVDLPSPAHPTTTSVKPTLPVETLIEIFEIALGSIPKPSSPFQSPISPSKPFASLLLASRTLRALAIPFLYHSITIARPSDWVTFFGVGRGVFVTGGDLEQKRKALEEVCLVEEADFPLDPKAFVASVSPVVVWGGATDCLAALDFSGLSADSITILSLPDKTASVESIFDFRAAKEMFQRFLGDERFLAFVTERMKSLRMFGPTAQVANLPTPEVARAALRSWVLHACYSSQDEALLRLLRSLHPTVVRISLQHSQRLQFLEQAVYADPIRIVTYTANAAQSKDRHPKRSFEGTLACVFPGQVVETAEDEEARIKAARAV